MRPSPIEQRHAQVFFQSLDLERDGRLREVQQLSRAAEAQLLGDCAKHFQSEICQLCQAVIIYGISSARSVEARCQKKFSCTRRSQAVIRWPTLCKQEATEQKLLYFFSRLVWLATQSQCPS